MKGQPVFTQRAICFHERATRFHAKATPFSAKATLFHAKATPFFRKGDPFSCKGDPFFRKSAKARKRVAPLHVILSQRLRNGVNDHSAGAAHGLRRWCATVDAHLEAPVGIDFIVSGRARCHSTALVKGHASVTLPSQFG